MDITRIVLEVTTGTDADADYDAPVFFGICGREFLPRNKTGDHFEIGKTDTFVFGDGSTVRDPRFNNPRNPQLDSVDLVLPAYLRSGSEFWQVESVHVWVYGDTLDTLVGEFRQPWLFPVGVAPQRLWLSGKYGNTMHLARVQ